MTYSTMILINSIIVSKKTLKTGYLQVRNTHTINNQVLNSINHIITTLYPKNQPLTPLEFHTRIAKILVSPINNEYYDLGMNQNIIKLLFGNLSLSKITLFNIMKTQGHDFTKIYLPQRIEPKS